MKAMTAEARRLAEIIGICRWITCLAFLIPQQACFGGQGAQQLPGQQGAVVRPVGTVKTVTGNSITLTKDGGGELTVVVGETTRLVRIAPGQKDLKDAKPIQVQELEAGDRLLVRGALDADAKTVLAASIIAMKKSDLAVKQARDREEWQRHGLGGLVSEADTAKGDIAITTNVMGTSKKVTVHVGKDTVLRRYAPDSVKFDDAKPGALADIKAGDQLRARGTRSPDGTELTADEVVSGTFRNIAGIINAVDAGAGTISVQDLATKKPVIVRIAADSQLRNLPLPMAQRIALRFKGAAGDAPGGAAGNGAMLGNANAPAASQPPTGSPPGGGPGGGRPGGGDLQQMINRMPPSSLADLKKGDAVMIVATQGNADIKGTVVTLLSGVEPILQASPQGSAMTILTPWSLSSAPSGDAGAQ